MRHRGQARTATRTLPVRHREPAGPLPHLTTVGGSRDHCYIGGVKTVAVGALCAISMRLCLLSMLSGWCWDDAGCYEPDAKSVGMGALAFGRGGRGEPKLGTTVRVGEGVVYDPQRVV